MTATEMTLRLDRTGQSQLVGRSFLKFFYPTLSSLMPSPSTPIFDLALRKPSLRSHHALGQLACCKLAQSAPFWGPYALTLPQCHTHGLYFVFIFLWQLHCAHLSKTTDHLEGQ